MIPISMRIVIANWAKIWDGASHGGGVNGYCQSLALSLRDRGHEVISLSSGMTIVPESPECTVRRHEDWLGIGVYEVINSPVMAPSVVQFKDPMGEVSAPDLERELRVFFERVRPDIVHFHNIEGFSTACVEVAKASGAAVAFSLHNYHPVCPQVYLMQGHRTPCVDARNGHACAGCIDANDPAEERALRVAKLRAARETPAAETYRRLQDELKDQFRWPVRVARLAKHTLDWRRRAAEEANAGGDWIPGTALDATPPDQPLATHGADARGQTERVVAERATATQSPRERTEPLLNVIQPEPACDLPPNDYGRRRQAMVAMLNACDGVLAVSDFVRRKYESFGVDPAVTRTLHIGTRITAIVDAAPELAFAPPPHDPAHPRPVRLMFMGYNHHYKGLSMLYESLERLEPEVLARLDLSIYALDGESIEWLFRRLEPRLANLTFEPGYQYQDIPWMLGGRDLTVVCSVWWDNAPQTVFESMACGVPVLGAELGGIPDFVRDGENGLLFRGNDREDLARRLREVVADPTVLNRLRNAVTPPKSIEAHAIEMEAIYEGLRNPARTVVRLGSGAPEPLD